VRERACSDEDGEATTGKGTESEPGERRFAGRRGEIAFEEAELARGDVAGLSAPPVLISSGFI
jgi:hypothetical protein